MIRIQLISMCDSSGVSETCCGASGDMGTSRDVVGAAGRRRSSGCFPADPAAGVAGQRSERFATPDKRRRHEDLAGGRVGFGEGGEMAEGGVGR